MEMTVDEEITYEYSKEYEECLERAKQLNGWEQFNLAMQLMNNFQKNIKDSDKELS